MTPRLPDDDRVMQVRRIGGKLCRYHKKMEFRNVMTMTNIAYHKKTGQIKKCKFMVSEGFHSFHRLDFFFLFLIFCLFWQGFSTVINKQTKDSATECLGLFKVWNMRACVHDFLQNDSDHTKFTVFCIYRCRVLLFISLQEQH